jgi:hypothetical protein
LSFFLVFGIVSYLKKTPAKSKNFPHPPQKAALSIVTL